jgi:hypothetical protein
MSPWLRACFVVGDLCVNDKHADLQALPSECPLCVCAACKQAGGRQQADDEAGVHKGQVANRAQHR